MRAGKIIERIRHMLKVKDCKHVCLFCEYYDMCKEEAKANEHEICNIVKMVNSNIDIQEWDFDFGCMG